MFIPPLICAGCRRPMRCEKNGFVAEALASGRPYYKVRTDKYRCPGCGAEVLKPAREAQAEHFEDWYAGIAADDVFELN